jgi:hypothetical protein
VSAITNLAQDPTSIWEQMCGKNRNRRVAMSDSGDELDEDDVETPEDALRALKLNRAALMSELPPSMKPIRVHTGPARDERGRPIAVAFVNGRMEIVTPGHNLAKSNSAFAPLPAGFGPQEDAKPERPLRLPKVAPNPQKRPDSES